MNKQKELHNINDFEEKNVNKFLTNSYLDDSKNQRQEEERKKDKRVDGHIFHDRAKGKGADLL